MINKFQYFLLFNKHLVCLVLLAISITHVNAQTPCTAGNVGGVVWKDVNNNGVKDTIETAGLADITVTAYNCNGMAVGTATTDAQGQYQFTTLTFPNTYRIEFSGLPSGYLPSSSTTTGRAEVQFVSAAACDIDFGAMYPSTYCDANPYLTIPCFAIGRPSALPEPVPAVVGDRFLYRNTALVGAQVQHEVVYATVQQVGAIHSTAYSRVTKKIYMASYMKRLTSFGNGNSGTDGSTGAIYSTNSDGTGLSVLIDLPASETGVNPHPTTTTDFNADPSWDQVSKISWGDIEASEDGQSLWAMNLFNRKLYKINLATGAVEGSWFIPGITGGPAFVGCSASQADRDTDLRPFALKAKDGIVYVGVTCTAESTVLTGPGNNESIGDTTKLNAYVFEFNINSNAFNAVPVLDFSLDNPPTVGTWHDYQPWNPNFIAVPTWVSRSPRPLLTDINFKGENMLIGIRNRTKDQYPAANGSFGPNGTTALIGMGGGAGGRILMAFKGASGWTIENSTAYTDNSGSTNLIEQDVAHINGDYSGSMVFNPSTGEIAAPATVGADAGGVAFIQQANNTWDKPSPLDNEYNTIFKYYDGAGANDFLFGKTNGLGEVDLLCAEATLQTGSYVWFDADKDGIQDPCETPLAGVKVALYKNVGGTLTYVANTTTGTNGEYNFTGLGAANENWTATSGTDSLLPNMEYQIVLGTDGTTSQYAAGILTVGGTEYQLSSANSGLGINPELNDSDAALAPIAGTNFPSVTFTTGTGGSAVHSFDAGFRPACTEPSGVTLNQTAPTCASSTPENNGKITLTAATNADKVGISTGATYSGTPAYAAATAIGTLPQDVQTMIPNTGGTYTLRLFNGADDCYKDTTITVAAVACACPTITYPLCPNESYTFTADAGLTNYQWYTVSGATETAIAGATMQTYTATAAGFYIWKGTDSAGCEKKLCCPVEVVPGTACCPTPNCGTATISKN